MDVSGLHFHVFVRSHIKLKINRRQQTEKKGEEIIDDQFNIDEARFYSFI